MPRLSDDENEVDRRSRLILLVYKMLQDTTFPAGATAVETLKLMALKFADMAKPPEAGPVGESLSSFSPAWPLAAPRRRARHYEPAEL
jgi:hypothetical protein